jgi:hypothetical protein
MQPRRADVREGEIHLPVPLKQLRDGWGRHLVQTRADAVRLNSIDRELISGSRRAIQSARELLESVDDRASVHRKDPSG